MTGYKLTIQIPKQDAQEVFIDDRLLFGSDEDCDVQISELGLSSRHALFTVKKGILMVQNLGGRHATKVNRQKLEQGKSYILDHKDKVILGKITVLIEEVEVQIEQTDVMEPEGDEQEEAHQHQETQSFQSLNNLTADSENEEVEDTDGEEEDSSPAHSLTSISVQDLLQSGKSQYLEGEDEDDHSSSDSSTLLKITNTFKKLFKRSKPKKEADQKGVPLPRISKLEKKGHEPLDVKKAGSRGGGPSQEIPGALIRLPAILINLTIAWLFSLILLPAAQQSEEVLNLAQQLNDGIEQYLLPHHELFAELMNFHGQLFVGLFFIIELVSGLLLGVTLGQWLYGIREISDTIPNRLKAMVRIPLGWFTAPFLIFDLPSIAKRRTFKEIFTFSVLEKRSPFMVLITSLVMVPILALLLALSPLIFFEGPSFAFRQERIILDPEDVETKRFYRMSSYQFDLTWSDQLDSLGMFLPSSLPRGGFGLEMWTNREGGIIRLTPEPRVDVREWIRAYFQYNRLGERFQRELYDFALTTREMQFNPFLTEEFVKMMRFAFSPNYTDPLLMQEALFDYGPMIYTFLAWREYLIGLLELEPEDQIEYVDIGNHSWLIITRFRESAQNVTLIPLAQVPALPFKLESQGLARQDVRRFLEDSLYFWVPIREDSRAIEQERDMSVFWTAPVLSNMMNHRFELEQNFPLDKRQIDYLFQRLHIRLKTALESRGASPFQRRFDERLEQLASILQRDEENLTPLVQAFAKRFHELHRAYRTRDTDYFQQDPRL
jgi:pSer/pThr/pTyr-binding forkhead associated (FHA) protein